MSRSFTFRGAFLTLLLAAVSFTAHGQSLNSDDTVIGTISAPGEEHEYTFYSEAGNTVSVSVADLDGGVPNVAGDLYPYVRILGPDGSQIGADFDTKVAYRYGRVTPTSGLHRIVVTDYQSSGTGRYELHFARAPDAQEHGGLVNGGSITEALSLGDIDSYTFHAEAGNRISVSVADLDGTLDNVPGDVYPYVIIYEPDGSALASNRHRLVADRANIETPVTGTYTVLVMNYEGTGVGAYEIHFARVPGARENGRLASGVPVTGDLTLGDIDSYVFHADVGDPITVRMTDLDGGSANVPGDLYPWVLIHNPDGTPLGSRRGTLEATRTGLIARQSGLHTVVATNYEGTGVGRYELELTSPNSNPPQPSAVRAPRGTGHARWPTFSWDAVGVASWYQIWTEDLSGNVLHRQWVTADRSKCSVMLGTCHATLSFAFEGSVRWWVQPWNVFGVGTWSGPGTFAAAAGPPSGASPLTPAGTASLATPEYTWAGAVNATWYYLWIDDGTGSRVRQWIRAGDAGCVSAGSTCAYRFDTSVVGNVSWWVRSWNPDGYGPWSARSDFVR